MRHQKLLFVTVFFLFFLQAIAQRPNRDYNKIGVSAGVVFSNIDTDDLPLTAGTGLAFGFETRGSFSRNVDFIYALSYYDAAMDLQTTTEVTTMKLSSVQLQFLGSLNIIRHHLSIEAGPAVAIQGKFKPQDGNDNLRLVAGYNNLSIEALREAATVDFRGVVGLTAGIEPFRVSLMYVRGFTNTFSKIQQASTQTANFEGNTDYLSLRAIVYF